MKKVPVSQLRAIQPPKVAALSYQAAETFWSGDVIHALETLGLLNHLDGHAGYRVSAELIDFEGHDKGQVFSITGLIDQLRASGGAKP